MAVQSGRSNPKGQLVARPEMAPPQNIPFAPLAIEVTNVRKVEAQATVIHAPMLLTSNVARAMSTCRRKSRSY